MKGGFILKINEIINKEFEIIDFSLNLIAKKMIIGNSQMLVIHNDSNIKEIKGNLFFENSTDFFKNNLTIIIEYKDKTYKTIYLKEKPIQLYKNIIWLRPYSYDSYVSKDNCGVYNTYYDILDEYSFEFLVMIGKLKSKR